MAGGGQGRRRSRKGREKERGERRKDLEDHREAILMAGLARLGTATSHF